MPTNYIKRIGLELEGGWRTRPGWELRRDGSVEVRADYVGELSSPPYSNLANAEMWMRRYYPHIVNTSCGFHIHVSLEPGLYSRLMCREFYEAFVKAYHDWGTTTFDGQRSTDNAVRFFQRLEGQNRYCATRFQPDIQTQVTSRQNPTVWESRYALLNFCWSLHGTLESRLLPMFNNVELSVSAMRVFTNLINSWLETEITKPEEALVVDVKEDAELNLGEEIIRIPDAPAAPVEEPSGGIDWEDLLANVMPGVFARPQPPPPEPATRANRIRFTNPLAGAPVYAWETSGSTSDNE